MAVRHFEAEVRREPGAAAIDLGGGVDGVAQGAGRRARAAGRWGAGVRGEPGAAVIDLGGEINGFAQEALDAAYAEAEKGNPESIHLNFEGVDYINSTGIALIVGLLARARAAKRGLSACGLSEHYVEIFNITRLSDFLSVFPDEKSALDESVAGGAPRRAAGRRAARLPPVPARRVPGSERDEPEKERRYAPGTGNDGRAQGQQRRQRHRRPGRADRVRRGGPHGRLQPGQRREGPRDHPELRGPRVHEQFRHRPPRHVAHPRQPREAAAPDLRTLRALSEHLPDHAPGRRPRHPRPPTRE